MTLRTAVQWTRDDFASGSWLRGLVAPGRARRPGGGVSRRLGGFLRPVKTSLSMTQRCNGAPLKTSWYCRRKYLQPRTERQNAAVRGVRIQLAGLGPTLDEWWCDASQAVHDCTSLVLPCDCHHSRPATGLRASMQH